MTTLCYNLAVHKNVQEKLIEEIDSIETIDHDTITDLHYLEAAINENLRMYPPAHVTRESYVNFFPETQLLF